jgi:hypothetical protein
MLHAGPDGGFVFGIKNFISILREIKEFGGIPKVEEVKQEKMLGNERVQ